MIENISKTSRPWYKEMLEKVRKEQLFKNWTSEQIFADILDEDKIKYFRQVVINPFVVDFAIPSKNLLIEIDGYSHKKTIKADADRDRYLKKLGFRVLRHWASDVEKVPVEISMELQTYLDTDKHLKEYFKALNLSKDDNSRIEFLDSCSIGVRRGKNGKPLSTNKLKGKAKKRARRREWARKNELAYKWKVPEGSLDSFLGMKKEKKLPYPYIKKEDECSK